MGMPLKCGRKRTVSKEFSSTEEAFNYIGSFINFERSKKQTIRDYRLDRMKKLLAHFGNPETSFKTIHIAGSKGKGSTAMFLASALTSAGYKTGLYTSPHITDYRERISLGGTYFDKKIYIDTANEIYEGLKFFVIGKETGSDEPTTFELLTLMAFMIFKKTECSWAVIETGIGGRLDATNVITPVASVITHIEMEHADILGDTIEKITYEKAGIIKKGIPVFFGRLKELPVKIIEERAKELSSPFFSLNTELDQFSHKISTNGTTVEFNEKNGEREILQLSSIGAVQAENALLAYLVLLKLLKPDRDLKKLLRRGLNEARLPGRFEIITNSNTSFIFDGAHTPVSVSRMMDTWKTIFSKKGILIFGSVSDKNPAEMAKLLSPYFDRIIISTPGTFKESYPDEVYKIFQKYNPNTELIKDPEAAYLKALEINRSDTKLYRDGASITKPILVSGSFYMVSEIRKLVLK